jgi:hypothetical protein
MKDESARTGNENSPICPYLSSEASTGTGVCLSQRDGPFTIRSRHIEFYCFKARHLECGRFLGADVPPPQGNLPPAHIDRITSHNDMESAPSRPSTVARKGEQRTSQPGGVPARRRDVSSSNPGMPMIVHPTSATLVNSGPLTVRGRCKPGGIVSLLDLHFPVGETRVDADGLWSVELPHVPAGHHEYSVRATNAVGSLSEESRPIPLTVLPLAVASPLESPPLVGPMSVHSVAEEADQEFETGDAQSPITPLPTGTEVPSLSSDEVGVDASPESAYRSSGVPPRSSHETSNAQEGTINALESSLTDSRMAGMRITGLPSGAEYDQRVLKQEVPGRMPGVDAFAPPRLAEATETVEAGNNKRGVDSPSSTLSQQQSTMIGELHQMNVRPIEPSISEVHPDGTSKSWAVRLLYVGVPVITLVFGALLVQHFGHWPLSRRVAAHSSVPAPAAIWSFKSVPRGVDQVLVSFVNPRSTRVSVDIWKPGSHRALVGHVDVPGKGAIELAIDSRQATRGLVMKATGPIISARTLVLRTSVQRQYGSPVIKGSRP